ncbi:Di-trans-poly-cis-decaprenylcistransferase [Cylindrobasidium torrendii FP15055 ss-10]|uniref:Alkyl transferase n=1 Tax=Cylindrobasidium torrendii FP15055 ss-10 TaxID=1314674 RepID=A0A0D7BH61_9AGAR|nr:Di-trans-poly-cis-decaprenylcistransferase [Cylindrobasidium torrendii FP15055 ss-10]
MAGLILSALQWLQTKVTTRAHRLLLRVLAAGPVPRHVAFVMDGNRRYARINHKKVAQGHADGYQALRRVLEICLRLNIKCVSVYAFAIENFKRSPEEVQALMELCQLKMLELCEHGDLLQEYGVRLNIVGRTDLLPEDVLAAVQRAQDLTKHNNRSILNVCMPYASTEEITTSVETCVREALESKDLNITTTAIEKNLRTTLAGSPPLDIIIRTSGVKRLSDFFLWQSCEGVQVQFSDAYWPDFGLFDFIPIILDFQRRAWQTSV